MVGARPRRYREGPSHWVLTPIAVSLLIHALVLHFFPAIDLMAPEAIQERLRETFYMAEFKPPAPTIVEAVERVAGIIAGEDMVEMNATGAVEPLGSAVLEVQPAQPAGIAHWPAIPDETVHKPQGPPPLARERLTEPSRRLLADSHPQAAPLSPRPVFLSRYRTVEPGPEAGFGAAVRPVGDGEPVGGAWASGGAEFIGHGSAHVGGEQLALARPGVPGGIEGAALPPVGLMSQPHPEQFRPLPRETLHEVDVKFELYREPEEPRAYFRMTISLRPNAHMEVIAKDVLMVVDVSRSIQAQELAVTRSVARQVLEQLDDGDRFNVALFSEQVRLLFPDFMVPTPERLAAVSGFIRRRGSGARTNVYRMLKDVVAALPETGRPIHVFLISDGVSTAGIEDARRIVRESRRMIGHHVSIFAFNAGEPHDPYLLDLLAYRSRGVFRTTPRVENSGQLFQELFRLVNRPILIDVRAHYGRLAVDETYPPVLPNLYVDRPIVIYGRCTPQEDFALRLTGTAARVEKEFFYHQVVPEEFTGDNTIAREWARGKIHHLVARIAEEGQRPEFVQEIRRLGTRYGVSTPYQR